MNLIVCLIKTETDQNLDQNLNTVDPFWTPIFNKNIIEYKSETVGFLSKIEIVSFIKAL